MAENHPPAADTARPGEYVVVARRYRPQGFEQLIGQEHVARGLTNAIQSQRVGHAYLFTGARGVGKTSTARILAKALECIHGPSPNPCNECDICRGISSGDDVDVIEIDGASNRGIDEIRQLRQNVNVRPSRARFKIYIIDEVHMLTREAFNALLKTLEEPPEHVKFIFCTTEAEKIPITILSRCQRFDFAGIQTPSIAQRLRQIVDAEGVEADTDALELLARRAAGSMRDSQSLLEQLLAFGKGKITAADVHDMLGTANDARLSQLTRAIVAHDPAAALAELDAALIEGVDPGQLLDQLLGYLRDCMAAAVGCKPESFLNASPSEYATVQQASQHLGLETILAVIGIIDQTLSRLRYSTHARVLAEMALVRACKLEDLDALPAAIAQLRAGAAVMISSGGATRPTAPEPMKDHAAQSASPSEIAKKKAPELTAVGTGGRATVGSATLDRPSAEMIEPSASREVGPIAMATPAKTLRVDPASPPQSSFDQLNDELASTATDQGWMPDEPSEASLSTAPPASRPIPASVAGSEHVLAALPANLHPAARAIELAALTPEQIPAIWQQMLASLTGLTAGFAQNANRVTLIGSDRLAVCFPTRYNFAMQNCQRPEPLAELERALAAAAGRPLRLEFHSSADEVVPAPKPAGSQARQSVMASRQRVAELSEHPLVRRASELFDARVVRVEES